MITKEIWNQYMIQEEIPIWLFFEYYKEAGGYLEDAHEFERQFVEIVTSNTMMFKDGKRIGLSYNTALIRLYRHYNTKFE